VWLNVSGVAGGKIMANEGTVSMLKAKTGESYAYSHAHSEMIRHIMKHKEAKQKEIEDTDYYKSGLFPVPYSPSRL
jgi:hypothetical protein